ncbi:MAG: polysaccharide biosynthesis/export family protein [Proteobacteria bacterium]|nr:polysaccharide biosynthesis/export family protein [Pseudomonadota bacterium]
MTFGSKFFPLLLLLSLLYGCAHAETVPAKASAPEPPAAPAALPEYKIQTGDLLDIKLYYHPVLNESVTVRPDGRISLQIVKEVLAAGMTPAALTDLLTAKYATQLKDPEVTVIVRSFSAQRVYVDGEVAKAGEVNLTGSMTVLQAISQAGGMRETAQPSEVLVIRRAADRKPTTLRVNLKEAVGGTDKGQDIYLMPYDIVFVPRSGIAHVNTWIDQYIRKNIPIPFGIYYGVNTN